MHKGGGKNRGAWGHREKSYRIISQKSNRKNGCGWLVRSRVAIWSNESKPEVGIKESHPSPGL